MTNEFKLPQEFEELGTEIPNMGFPTKEGKTYSCSTETYCSFVITCVCPSDVAMNYDDVNSIIEFEHNDPRLNWGIIEANNGVTSNNLKYVYLLQKVSIENEEGIHMKNSYCVNMNIDIGNNEAYFINASFDEEGISGSRDTAVYIMLKKDNPSFDVDANWSRDPYDKNFKEGFLMNLSEDKKYDEMFSDHPLTKARELINYLVNNN